jgi:hypothetical protein
MSYDFPPEVIELRRQLFAAEEAWAAAGARGDDDVNGAYLDAQRLTLALHRNEWMRDAGNGHALRMALREAAKNLLGADTRFRLLTSAFCMRLRLQVCTR